jgi:DNA-binding MarR family transcriptional regulator
MAKKRNATERSPAFFVETGELLAAFSRVYYRWLWAQLKPAGSAPGWQAILGILKSGGPKIMSAISAEMNEAPRVITDAVDGLERLGLVQRISHPTDRRAKLIALTEAGEAFLEVSRNATHQALTELLSDFSEADEDQLVDMVSRLVTAIKAHIAEESIPSTLELATNQNHRRNRREHYVEVIRPL